MPIDTWHSQGKLTLNMLPQVSFQTTNKDQWSDKPLDFDLLGTTVHPRTPQPETPEETK